MSEIKIIGSRLKELRKLRGFSQEFLSDVSFVSDRTIRSLEKNGKTKLATLKLLSLALMCQPEYLTDENAILESKNHYADLIEIISEACSLGTSYGHGSINNEELKIQLSALFKKSKAIITPK